MGETRIAPAAAAALRRAIVEHGGRELLALGEVDAEGRIGALRVLARGSHEAVPALLSRARPGQVLVHNHPSGRLEPSEADLEVAARCGERGVGAVIVDNELGRALWLVEPAAPRRELPPEELERDFDERLPAALPGFQRRPAQADMARAVLDRMNRGGWLVAEAGTGTGKSLAYLLPALRWALLNGERVAVATYTRNLQDQLVRRELPLLRRAGLDFRAAVVKGRGNYLCPWKLDAALAERGMGRLGALQARLWRGREERLLAALVGWAEAGGGERSELPFELPPELWEDLASDAEQCLGNSCPHHARCPYHEALRRAAGAQLLVVNQSLLLADLWLRREGGELLPPSARVVVDEAHHLEDAATGALSQRASAGAVARALRRFRGRGRRAPLLQRLLADWDEQALGRERAEELRRRAAELEELLLGLRSRVELLLAGLATRLELEPGSPALAVEEAGEGWEEPVEELAGALAGAARAVARVERPFDELELPPERARPVLELRAARRRLAEQAGAVRAFLEPPEGHCRWFEPDREGRAVLASAPVEVGPLLRELLFEGVEGGVLTSATLCSGRDCSFFLRRVGLPTPPPGDGPPGAAEGTPLLHALRSWPSPFDYARQAVLALPRDLPAPGEPGYDEAMAAAVLAALEASRGGAFVLCTSFRQLHQLADAAEEHFGRRLGVYRQGRLGRHLLLERFREDPDGVLFGTRSFWEGVSVEGPGLRLVVIPRLPFGVPTEPLARARRARLEEAGLDGFRHFSLPRAVLALRQGFGRLIRSERDRGAVVLLDRRLHDRWYGRVFLRALPPARRLRGPSRLVFARLAEFFQEGLGDGLEAGL